ncbi:MAG: hypothetical protein OCC49_15255 [Fibrobacterales bacterium]
MRHFVVFFIALCLWNCSTKEVAGNADEFPNYISHQDSITLAQIGERLPENIGITQNWNRLDSSTPTFTLEQKALLKQQPENTSKTDFLQRSIQIPPNIALLTKTTDSLLVDMSDSAKGIVYVYHWKIRDNYNEFDTLTLLLDHYTFDAIKDNETIIAFRSKKELHSGLSTEYIEYLDGDGDGIISPDRDTSATSSTFFTHRTITPLKTTETFNHLGAGPDNDFNTDNDNPIYAAYEHDWNATIDTLSFTAYFDKDNDGIILNPILDSTKVMINTIKNNLTSIERESATMVIFPDNPNNNYATHFVGHATTPTTEKKVTTTPLKIDGEFYPGDSIIVITSTLTFNEIDTLITQNDTIYATLSTASSLNSITQGYHFISATYTPNAVGDTDRTSHFTLTPDTPLTDSDDFTYGDFSWDTQKPSGQTTSTFGTISPNGTTAIVVIDDRHYTIYWNPGGSIRTVQQVQ